MGPLNNRAQLEKVRRYLAIAAEEGGIVMCGETKDPPLNLPEANTEVGEFVLLKGICGMGILLGF